MAFRFDATPNANAMKITVAHGQDAPRTVRDPDSAQAGLPQELIAIDGIVQVFFSDGFLTVNKEPSAQWEALLPQVEDVLARHLATA